MGRNRKNNKREEDEEEEEDTTSEEEDFSEEEIGEEMDEQDVEYYRKKYDKMVRKNKNIKKAVQEFETWCKEEEGLAKDDIRWLIEKVQYGAMDKKLDSNNYQDIEEETFNFSAAFTMKDLATSEDQRIYLEGDDRWKEFCKRKTVVNVSQPVSGNNSAYTSVYIKAGMKTIDHNNKGMVVKESSGAKPALSQARSDIKPLQGEDLKSLLNSSTEPITLSERNFDTLDQVFESLGTETTPVKDKSGKQIIIKHYLVYQSHELYPIIKGDKKNGLDKDNRGFYVLSKKDVEKYGKMITSGLDDVFRCNGEDLVVFLEPTANVLKLESRSQSSQKGKLVSNYIPSSKSSQVKKPQRNLSWKDFSPTVLANAGIKTPSTINDEAKYKYVPDHLTTVSVGIKIWCTEKKEEKEAPKVVDIGEAELPTESESSSGEEDDYSSSESEE